MPNFGKLKKHLFGSALSICDKLVIDEHWNLCVGNILAGNICGTLLGSDIIEKDPTKGIRFFGNINIQDGFFLTGNVDLTGVMFSDFFTTGNIYAGGNILADGNITTMEDLCVVGTAFLKGGACTPTLAVTTITGKTPGDGPIIQGNSQLIGALEIVGGPLTVPQVFSTGVCTDVLLVNTLTPKLGTDINVMQGNVILVANAMPHFFCGDLLANVIMPKNPEGIDIPMGNVSLLDPLGYFCGNVRANAICSKNPGVPLSVCGGGLTVIDGCFSLPKSTSLPDGENEVATMTPAGVAQMMALGSGGIAPGEIQSVRLTNPCLTANSVVLATVGVYTGNGIPIVHRTEPSVGDADIFILNVDTGNVIDQGTIIPIQYLIV